jgi:hypothetical protein
LQFTQANAQTKNCKRASTSPTQKRISKYFFQRFKKIKNATHSRHSMTQKLNTDKGLQERWTNTTGYKPKGGASCCKDIFVAKQTLVFQIKFCGKSPALRVAASRKLQPKTTPIEIK